MEFNLKNMLDVHVEYINYLLKKTFILHQDVKDISGCGNEVESAIREFFQSFVPERFKVTHGYILYAPDQISEPKLSKQIDLILVDRLVTHKIFNLDNTYGKEIVPVESVVGLFEIKRTLTEKSFLESLNHLKEVIKTVSISKTDATHYLPGGISLVGSPGGIYSNPLIGIISLDNKDFGKNAKETGSKVCEYSGEVIIDLIASLSGLLILPCENQNSENNKIVNLLVKNVYHNSNQNYALYDKRQNDTQISILSKLIGYICAYLGNCAGRRINPNNYFLNDKILKLINSISKDKE